MNYLAHALLSPVNRNLVLLGNLACDMLRPSDAADLDDEIKEGLLRHQAIDRMTDAHKGFKTLRDALSAAGHPYAGVLTDIIFDHYLASSWDDYSNDPLSVFSARVYEVLENKSYLIPGSFPRMTRALRSQDWFGSYAADEGLKNALYRLNYRSSRYIDPDEVFDTALSIRSTALPGFRALMKDLMISFGPDVASIQA